MLALVVVAVADTTTKRGLKTPVDLSVPASKDAATNRLRDVARETKPFVPVDCEKAPAPGSTRDPRCSYGTNGPMMPAVPQVPADSQSGRRPVVENPPVRLNQ